MILAFPPHPSAYFLVPGYLLRAPDNSNFFRFPLARGFELSSLRTAVKGARENPSKNSRNESIADKFAFSNLENSAQNVAKTNDWVFDQLSRMLCLTDVLVSPDQLSQVLKPQVSAMSVCLFGASLSWERTCSSKSFDWSLKVLMTGHNKVWECRL